MQELCGNLPVISKFYDTDEIVYNDDDYDILILLLRLDVSINKLQHSLKLIIRNLTEFTGKHFVFQTSLRTLIKDKAAENILRTIYCDILKIPKQFIYDLRVAQTRRRQTNNKKKKRNTIELKLIQRDRAAARKNVGNRDDESRWTCKETQTRVKRATWKELL